MSRNITLAFDREIPGVLYQQVEAYDLFDEKILDKLDALCMELGVKPLGEFWSEDWRHLPVPQQMSIIMGAPWQEEWGPEPERHSCWFEAAEGAASVNALLTYLKVNPGTIRRGMKELKEFGVALNAAKSENARFHFYADI